MEMLKWDTETLLNWYNTMICCTGEDEIEMFRQMMKDAGICSARELVIFSREQWEKYYNQEGLLLYDKIVAPLLDRKLHEILLQLSYQA